MGQKNTIRLGTRGSQLAIAQANHIKNKIIDVDSTIDVNIRIIRTKGDECDDPIDQMGGKGVFVKDIEQAFRENNLPDGDNCYTVKWMKKINLDQNKYF